MLLETEAGQGADGGETRQKWVIILDFSHYNCLTFCWIIGYKFCIMVYPCLCIVAQDFYEHSSQSYPSFFTTNRIGSHDRRVCSYTPGRKQFE